jgi:protein ImuA
MIAALPHTKKDIIGELRKSIFLWEGFTPPAAGAAESFGLGPVEAAFPNGVFPAGAIHEFLSAAPEDAAASGGFMAALLAILMRNGGPCLWISMARTLFPPALKTFGVEPDRIIFIDLHRERDVLWAMEEALKCDGLAAVVGEIGGMNFTQSRRLQLAVEQSRVTGLILRNDPRKLTTSACVARWKITSLPSETEDGLPGIGFPRWSVELLKVRNGNPGVWKMEWSGGRFVPVAENVVENITHETRKAG